jgi:hypothetical protein
VILFQQVVWSFDKLLNTYGNLECLQTRLHAGNRHLHKLSPRTKTHTRPRKRWRKDTKTSGHSVAMVPRNRIVNRTNDAVISNLEPNYPHISRNILRHIQAYSISFLIHYWINILPLDTTQAQYESLTASWKYTIKSARQTSVKMCYCCSLRFRTAENPRPTPYSVS